MSFTATSNSVHKSATSLQTSFRNNLTPQKILKRDYPGGLGKVAQVRQADLYNIRLNATQVRAPARHLVIPRRGSGVYVLANQSDSCNRDDESDRLVLQFVRAAQMVGLTASGIRNRLDHWLAKRPNRFVFVHPEQELRTIIIEELKQALTWPIEGCDAEPTAIARFMERSMFLTVPSKQSSVAQLLPATSEMLTLEMSRVDRGLAQYLPIRPELLVTIASAWPGFLRIAQTVITAAGCDPDFLLFHDARRDQWRLADHPSIVIVCDFLPYYLSMRKLRALCIAITLHGTLLPWVANCQTSAQTDDWQNLGRIAPGSPVSIAVLNHGGRRECELLRVTDADLTCEVTRGKLGRVFLRDEIREVRLEFPEHHKMIYGAIIGVAIGAIIGGLMGGQGNDPESQRADPAMGALIAGSVGAGVGRAIHEHGSVLYRRR